MSHSYVLIMNMYINCGKVYNENKLKDLVGGTVTLHTLYDLMTFGWYANLFARCHTIIQTKIQRNKPCFFFALTWFLKNCLSFNDVKLIYLCIKSVFINHMQRIILLTHDEQGEKNKKLVWNIACIGILITLKPLMLQKRVTPAVWQKKKKNQS